jgi:hypothetical protein
MNKIFVGIDPGVSGAIAAIGSGSEFIYKYEQYCNFCNQNLFSRDSRLNQNMIVYMELVHAMPKQGVCSMFTFGENNGWWKGHLDTLGIRYTLVTPQTWKKALVQVTGIQIPEKKYGETIVTKGKKAKVTKKLLNTNELKQWSIKVCEKLFPELDLGRNHNKADALCIAYYARLKKEVT